ncbi:hypothetical protein ABIF13_007311 [Bradyrhizobium elkanii]
MSVAQHQRIELVFGDASYPRLMDDCITRAGLADRNANQLVDVRSPLRRHG